MTGRTAVCALSLLVLGTPLLAQERSPGVDEPPSRPPGVDSLDGPTAPSASALEPGSVHPAALLDRHTGRLAADLRPPLSDGSVGPVRQDEPWRDAWGQEKNFGLAAVEVYMGNFLPWVFNELVPGRAELKISQISPRSWLRNLEEGFGWDDNAFQVNHFAHPFQGSIYFNSGRSNGYGYWSSLLFATAGSFHWECCGETHLMSVNDWVNTSIGGAAVGEMLYRTSSMVLDNTATGSERAWREVAGFLMAPTRGFTRLVTGNAARVYANPEHPNDRLPNRLESQMSFGVRISDSERRSGEIVRNDGQDPHGFIDFQLYAGSLFDLDRKKPFEFFTLATQFNLRQEKGLGKLTIQGNLHHWDLGQSGTSSKKLVVVQDFDYENTEAFEFGGQSVSLMFLHRFSRDQRMSYLWEAAGAWMIMGGVNSEFALEAEVPGIRERLREYDFGTGPGGRLGFQVLRDGYRWFEAAYRVQYLWTLNGSNANGADTNHLVQMARGRLTVPVWRRLGVGAEYEYFLRDSHFESDLFEHIEQRVPRWQVFLTWNPTRNVGN